MDHSNVVNQNRTMAAKKKAEPKKFPQGTVTVSDGWHTPRRVGYYCGGKSLYVNNELVLEVSMIDAWPAITIHKEVSDAKLMKAAEQIAHLIRAIEATLSGDPIDGFGEFGEPRHDKEFDTRRRALDKIKEQTNDH